MIRFVTGLFSDLVSSMSWWQRLEAVEALDRSSTNPAARPYRVAAFCFFMAGSMLLLSAALVHTFVGPIVLNEILGFSGLGCLQVCFICGIWYRKANSRPTMPPEAPRHCERCSQDASLHITEKCAGAIRVLYFCDKHAREYLTANG